MRRGGVESRALLTVASRSESQVTTVPLQIHASSSGHVAPDDHLATIPNRTV
jgi:hypothetical protein